jgi:RNA polymerase sigma-70 factor (ECF subfamily)
MYDNQQDDRELVSRLQAGDIIAFDNIYKKFNRKLFRFAYYILKSREDAENIVQEVFVKIWENREKIRLHNSFSSYIFTITHHTTIDLLRQKLKDNKFKDYLLSLQEPFENKVQTDVEFAEAQSQAQEAIAKLTERQRQIYLMHREDGLTYNEIADKLRISINTVENHMVAALKTLREHLKTSSFSFVGILFYFLFL